MPRKLPVGPWPVRCSDRIRERAELIAIRADEEAVALKAAALIKSEPTDATTFDSEFLVNGDTIESIDQLSQEIQAKSGRRSGRKTRRERVKYRAHGVANLPRGVNQADSILKQRSSAMKRAIAEAVSRSHRLGAKKATTVAVSKAVLKCHREARRARSRSRAPVAKNRDSAMSPGANTSSLLSKIRTDPTQGFLGPDNGELLVVTGMLYVRLDSFSLSMLVCELYLYLKPPYSHSRDLKISSRPRTHSGSVLFFVVGFIPSSSPRTRASTHWLPSSMGCPAPVRSSTASLFHCTLPGLISTILMEFVTGVAFADCGASLSWTSAPGAFRLLSAPTRSLAGCVSVLVSSSGSWPSLLHWSGCSCRNTSHSVFR